MNSKSITEDKFRDMAKLNLDKNGVTDIVGYNGMYTTCSFVNNLGTFWAKPISVYNGVTLDFSSYINKREYVENILSINNTQYKNGDIKILSEIISTQKKVYVQDKYGICNMLLSSLMANKKVSMQSAVDKLSYYKNQIYEVSEAYRNGSFEILDYIGKDYWLVRDKYGDCKIHTGNLRSGKCPSVNSAIDKDAYIINKFREKHGDEFDYSKVKYVDDTTNVIITCKKHGPFQQMPTNHLRYNKCPMCKRDLDSFTKTSLMRRVKEKGRGMLYLIKVFDDKEEFLKIGYTTDNIRRRYNGLKKSHNYSYEIIKEVVVNDGEKLFNIENLLKNTFRVDKHIPQRHFAGAATEVFCISKYDDILRVINCFEEELGIHL